MKWFGKSWGAPCCDTGEHVATPVGEPCLRCHVLITPADQGFALPFHTIEGYRYVPYHQKCLVEAVTPCPGCPECRPSAVTKAVSIMRDPTNRSIACLCGVTYLSGAAERDAEGRPLCIGCGAPAA